MAPKTTARKTTRKTAAPSLEQQIRSLQQEIERLASAKVEQEAAAVELATAKQLWRLNSEGLLTLRANPGAPVSKVSCTDRLAIIFDSQS